MLSGKQRAAIFEKLKGKYNKQSLPSVKAPATIKMPDAPKAPKELKSKHDDVEAAGKIEKHKDVKLFDESTIEPSQYKYVGNGRKVRFLKLKRALGGK